MWRLKFWRKPPTEEEKELAARIILALDTEPDHWNLTGLIAWYRGGKVRLWWSLKSSSGDYIEIHPDLRRRVRRAWERAKVAQRRSALPLAREVLPEINRYNVEWRER